ncbi:hypothetical protein HYFRA_00005219 [Hymenoscyphus fraxineus]|uniref:Uncharacterized protein n=1 Tax=Hymenoscyphus fraxineus TaxID=746836 RepID=A0A9N9L8D5_9HELO|nr:hypothetical protein HYFRA_00005219 [Hymenoscyphus fraxineus]
MSNTGSSSTSDLERSPVYTPPETQPTRINMTELSEELERVADSSANSGAPSSQNTGANTPSESLAASTTDSGEDTPAMSDKASAQDTGVNTPTASASDSGSQHGGANTPTAPGGASSEHISANTPIKSETTRSTETKPSAPSTSKGASKGATQSSASTTQPPPPKRQTFSIIASLTLHRPGFGREDTYTVLEKDFITIDANPTTVTEMKQEILNKLNRSSSFSLNRSSLRAVWDKCGYNPNAQPSNTFIFITSVNFEACIAAFENTRDFGNSGIDLVVQDV